MDQNVEIKARVYDLKTLEKKILEIASEGPTLLRQTDVFFHVSRGRLKLRYLNGKTGELVYYERINSPGPTKSQYKRYLLPNPFHLEILLGTALGIRGVVEKKRKVYLIEKVRIHLDQVRGLGSFLELEVVLQKGQKTSQGIKDAEKLIKLLGVSRDSLLAEAYIDMLKPLPKKDS